MEELIRVLEYESESSTLDYKFNAYDLSDKFKKHEFLKDLSSMANAPSEQDKYIIIGVKEHNGLAESFQNIENTNDEANYQQYLKSNIEPEINFEYKQFKYKNYKLYCFRLYSNHDRPYLFKSRIIRENLTKFNVGDGVIRVGTSTRRLSRSDLDMIYSSKFENKDRKSDLEVKIVIGKPDDSEFDSDKFRFIDVVVFNKSNKSIGFDAEMKIFNTSRTAVYTKRSIKETILIPRHGNMYDVQQFHIPQIPNFEIDIEETEEYSLITRLKGRNETYSISIPQSSSYSDLFFQELIINPNGYRLITGELILKSDEFTDGPMVVTFQKEIKNA